MAAGRTPAFLSGECVEATQIYAWTIQYLYRMKKIATAENDGYPLDVPSCLRHLADQWSRQVSREPVRQNSTDSQSVATWLIADRENEPWNPLCLRDPKGKQCESPTPGISTQTGRAFPDLHGPHQPTPTAPLQMMPAIGHHLVIPHIVPSQQPGSREETSSIDYYEHTAGGSSGCLSNDPLKTSRSPTVDISDTPWTSSQVKGFANNISEQHRLRPQLFQVQSYPERPVVGYGRGQPLSHISGSPNIQIHRASLTPSIEYDCGNQKAEAKMGKFQCSFCEKFFPFMWKLNDHEVTHTGHKSFRCEDCEVGFSRKRDLLKHRSSKKHQNLVLKHSMDNPFGQLGTATPVTSATMMTMMTTMTPTTVSPTGSNKRQASSMSMSAKGGNSKTRRACHSMAMSGSTRRRASKDRKKQEKTNPPNSHLHPPSAITIRTRPSESQFSPFHTMPFQSTQRKSLDSGCAFAGDMDRDADYEEESAFHNSASQVSSQPSVYDYTPLFSPTGQVPEQPLQSPHRSSVSVNAQSQSFYSQQPPEAAPRHTYNGIADASTADCSKQVPTTTMDMNQIQWRQWPQHVRFDEGYSYYGATAPEQDSNRENRMTEIYPEE